MRQLYLTEGQEVAKKRHSRIVMFFLVLIIIVFMISLNVGVSKLSVGEVVKTLFNQGTAHQELVLFDFRLPRMLISILVGMGLATAGAVMQGVSRNALADPGILGINAGAGLAIMLYISFFPATADVPVFALPIIAIIGAAGTALIIYMLSYKRHEGISPMRLLLTGIAVAAGISSLIIVLTLTLTPDKYQFLATWLAGSIWGSNWKFVMALLPWILILLPLIYVKSNVLNVLNLGDSLATGLGTSIERERRWLLLAAVGLAASSVSVSGGIGFVGLIAPHVARQLVGAKHQILLPVAALVGALLVLIADTIGRAILQPSEVPAGIVVAVIGAPYFLYLLTRLKE
ncbi:FecCD family ABC transporter permease [Lysinibacillus sp. NPDC056185]|uniref:FecCD family ABC transporter permease n=1 Tax=Lysinibacillus sp. NPDC056185 TaxID=3345739 RepID=UPI0039EE3F94